MCDMNSPPKRCRIDHDEAYFRAYADLRIHEEMLQDHARTFTYRQAILRNYESIRGKVVADVGAGTGILSAFCVHAGAKKVYAIEGSDLAAHTERVVQENNMQDRITVIKGKVEEIELPEKVDVIVSEWMGYFLLYESMLPSVLYARDKWLKQDGLLLPSEATLYLAPFADPGELEDRLCFWQEMEGRYKVKMSCLSAVAKDRLTHHVQLQTLASEDILAHPTKICHLDLKCVTTEQLKNIKSQFRFQCFGHNKVHGLASWFTVTFPGGTSLSTSPYHTETHWSQCIMYWVEPEEVRQDTVIEGSIDLQPNAKYTRWLDVAVRVSVGGKEDTVQHYVMDDDAS